METAILNESIGVSFFQEYFVKPIIDRSGYNLVNTTAYGVLLIIGVYALFKFLKHFKYEINLRFLKASIPFILLVSVWHVLTDAGVYPYGFLTTTPGLYVPVLSLLFPLLALAKKVEDWYGTKYEMVYSGVSSILLLSQFIILLTLMPGRFQVDAFGLSTYYLLLSCIPILILSNYWGLLKDKLNLFMILSHFLDASVTHVSLEYFNYFEQHVIPRFFIDLTSTSLVLYPLKFIVLVIVMKLLDDSNDNPELNNMIKMIFITYGLAIGVRNFLRLIIGV